MKLFFAGFKHGMQKFGQLIGQIVNFVLLISIYFIAIGLTSLMAKFSGKHFLDFEIKSEVETYWQDINLGKKPIEKYYKQF
jgi:large-conductance mechanosensitive channel